MGRPRNEVTIKSIRDMVTLGKADLQSFSKWPLGYVGNYQLWECQKEWQRHIQEAYLNKLKNPKDGRHLCLLAPSEHGKTYGMDIPFILWALARNRNLRIGIVGSKDDLAANIGHGIDRMFKQFGSELAHFGLVPDYPWSAYQKFLQRDDPKLIHPSIMFLGPESEVQGVRFDIVFLTDFATFKNQRTMEQRLKYMDWLDQTLFPRLEPWGFIMAEGHHVDPEDIYSELKEREDEWKFLSYSAIIEEPTPDNPKGRTLAPEHWGYKQLAKIRKRNPRVFQLIFQNQPVQRTGFTSRDAFERMYDRSRPLLTHCTPDVRCAYKSIEISIDPAFTIKRYSSYTVCLVWGRTETGKRDLLGGWRLKLLPDRLKEKVVQTILSWRPDNVYIESNAAQVFFIHEVKARLGQYADRIKSVYTGGTVEDSVEEGLGLCVSLVEAGDVTFPYLNKEAQDITDCITNEVLGYPEARHRDGMMSWQIYERGLRKVENFKTRMIKFQGISAACRRKRRRL